MNVIEAALREIATMLDASSRRWALVGGLAVSARANPRTTRDVDVAVAVLDDREAEQLVHLLQGTGAYRVVAVVEQKDTKRLATVRLESLHAGKIIVDVLLASSGIEAEVAASADRIEIVPGLVLPVAQTGHLIALKVLARDDRYRPQDLDDLRALIRVAAAEQLELASDAARLIEARGFQRGRRLSDALNAVIAETLAS